MSGWDLPISINMCKSVFLVHVLAANWLLVCPARTVRLDHLSWVAGFCCGWTSQPDLAGLCIKH